MNAEQWARVKTVFDLALDAPAEQQFSIVQSSCKGDTELEAQVLRLLHADSTAGEFLEKAAGDLHDYLQPKNPSPAFAAGMVLARRFEIKSFINAGGMGEVYEAWDADLNQAVALKTILPHIAANAGVIERFKQEVRHTREISHPNICRVHELFVHEDPDGSRTWFLSMELLRGPTLLERIQSDGRLLPAAGVPIAAQLLSGIEAAHALGLTHRDFKSSNVILVEADNAPTRAVIMDFGLSIRVLPGEAANHEPAGMGTPVYMAPEQEQQGSVGPLVDQYALGVVLYEMMTGSLPQPYQAGGDIRTRAVKRGYPARWDGVIRRCMQQDPSLRFKDIAAVRKALMIPGWRQHAGWGVAAAVAVLAIGMVILAQLAGRQPVEPCRICNIVQMTPDTDESESPSLSRNGHSLAYSSDRADSGNLDIFVQTLPSGRLERITRDRARDESPSLSPDGSVVAFRSERDGGGLYLAKTHDGSEAKLLVAGGRNPQISPDGRSLVYWTGDPDSSIDSGKVFRMPLDGEHAGGEPVQIAPTFADARYPFWNSEGSAVLFTGCSSTEQMPPGCFDWWIDKGDGSAPINTHAFSLLRTSDFNVGRLGSMDWVGTEIVFSAMGSSNRLNLASMNLDPETFQVKGSPKWLLPEQAGDLDPSLTSHGSIAFTRTSGALHIWRIVHALAGKKSQLEKVVDDAEVDGSPYVAEGGRFIVYARGRTARRMIMFHDIARGEDTIAVNIGTPVQAPIIDQAGKWIAYQQTETDGSSAIYAGLRGGEMKRMCQNCTEPAGWFEGDHAFFYRDGRHSSIALLDPRTGARQILLQKPDASLNDVSWSSANGFAVFVESIGDRKKMYAVRLRPGSGQPVGSWLPIADEQGTPLHPRWSGDGKTIFYVSNLDGFSCIYGRSFTASSSALGPRFPVAHFHNQRASIDNVLPRVFNLSASDDTLYLNLGEQSSTIQLGAIKSRR